MINKIMIPVAALAITVTGASAFNSDLLQKIDVDLSDNQISALEEAHELREGGADRDDVKAILEDADIDKDTMREIREAAHEYRQGRHEEVKSAVDAEDYDAFKNAIEGSPMAEVIDSESDFARLVEAHELREDGDKEGAQEIMAELGIERGEGKGFGGKHYGKHGAGFEGKNMGE
jgi:hypothetical protein